MENHQDLQIRLGILFHLIEGGQVKFTTDVPETIRQIGHVKRNPDGSFDLSTVGPLVRALCWALDAHPLAQALQEGGEPFDLPPFELPELGRQRPSEGDFTRDLVAAGNIVRKYLLITASLIPLVPLGRLTRGVLVGSMIRLYKLYDSMMHLAADNRLETASIIFRCVVDGAVNLRFVLQSEDRDSLAEEVVRASLAYEKKLWEEIDKRKQDPPLPIEKRMIASIKRVFADAGIDPETVSWSDRHWGGDMYQKAGAVGWLQMYEFAFRTASHSVHGTWSDLLVHHISSDRGRYIPEPEYSRARPQIILAASVLCLEVAAEYGRVVFGDASAELVEKLHRLEDWFTRISEQHEKWQVAQETQASE